MVDNTYILVIIGFLITLGAQGLVTSRYSKYGKIESSKDINEAAGTLTDHYDPSKKTVNLSTDIYKGTSIAAVAVAAHECGHAIQDKNGYLFLRIRHSLIPTVNICSKLGYVAIFIGLFAVILNLAVIGLIMLCAILVDDSDSRGVSNMLFAAALTYVAALASSVLQILRLALIVSGNRRRN